MRKLKHAQEKVDQLNIDAIGDEFIRGSERRLRQFGKFTWTCVYIATYCSIALAFCVSDYFDAVGACAVRIMNN